jgi:hypothetical protein
MNNTFQNTNYYNDIMKAYDAGLSKDTETRDNLVEHLGNSLNDSCKAYTSNPNVVNNAISKRNAASLVDLNQYSGKYRNDIEFQNSLKSQLISDEETYFVNKYGSVVYKYLTDKREQIMSQWDTEQSQTQTTTNCPQTTPGRSTVSNRVTTGKNKIVRGYYDENGDFAESPEIVDENNGLEFYNMFSKYLPFIDPDVTNRKIEYRSSEHDFLMKINSIMNGMYYILFVIMIILLAGGNNLQLKQRSPIYIGLAILPFIYPYFYKLLNYIYGYFTNNKNIHGPKNAFLDTDGEKNLVDAYNN